MKQEVTRQKKAQAWSLDEVEYTTEVQRDVVAGDDGRLDGKTLTAPSEGVLIHGLYLEGAGWSKPDKRLEDSTPKELFYTFPIILVSAMSTAAPQPGVGGAKAKQDDRAQEKSLY